MTVIALVHLYAHENRIKEALAASQSMRDYCLSLNICTRFDIMQSRENRNHLTFVEEWNSVEEHNDFLTTLVESKRYDEMTGLFISGPKVEYFEVK